MAKSKKSSKNNPPPESIIEIDEGVFGTRLSERSDWPERGEMSTSNGVTLVPNSFGGIDIMLSDEDDDFPGIRILLTEEDDDDENVSGNFDLTPFCEPEEFEENIANILGTQDIEVNERNLKTYSNYLKKTMTKPCYLRGIEEFEWEKYYLSGSGSEKEYAKKQKTNPSYEDTFKWVKFADEIDEEQGLFVIVERTSDRRKFTMPLSNLEAVDESSSNSRLFGTYYLWLVYY
ncbi:hypothetical protein [Phormidium sp. CCY1219]|uniref:hypothetical protein n=1 Tax=Phormidium sp. CCY1219 TaxID=2886104 RepID=UPI002D1F3FE9|nr:hypothetical protein [Phormidium sp. CCY1219]MEB3829720.1 hypothetical protein [Phormidium sp. CCY1219]